MRASAGTRSPILMFSTSPGTRSSDRTETTEPSLITDDSGDVSSFSDAMDRLARYSLFTSTSTSTVMITKMVAASSMPPQMLYMTPTKSSRRIIGSTISSFSMSKNVTLYGSKKRFGPDLFRRSLASAAPSPLNGSVPSSLTISSSSLRYQSMSPPIRRYVPPTLTEDR